MKTNEPKQGQLMPSTGHGWMDDPLLREVDGYGEVIWPLARSDRYTEIGTWEQEREQLVATIRFLIMEVRDLFERVAEHDDDLFHHRA